MDPVRETPAIMIPGPGLRGDQSGDLDTGGAAGYANVMVFGSNSEKKYVAPSGGQYVSLQGGGCEGRQHGASLAGQSGVWRYQLDDSWAGDGVAVAVLKESGQALLHVCAGQVVSADGVRGCPRARAAKAPAGTDI